MSKTDAIELKGVVRDVYQGSNFKVELCDENGEPMGHEIYATISGKLRINRIRIVRGDKVKVELSPYGLENGRIVWRFEK